MDSIDLSLYQHETTVNVRFMDLDALQHVNNARYLNFLEEARINYCQEVLGFLYNVNEFNVLVARIEIDFMKPILFNSTLKLFTRVSKIGRKSFVFDTVIGIQEADKIGIVSRALQTLVCFDPETNQSILVPTNIRQKIKAYENNL